MHKTRGIIIFFSINLLEERSQNKSETGNGPDLQSIQSISRLGETTSDAAQHVEQEEQWDHRHRESAQHGFHGKQECDPRQTDQ